MSFTEFSYQLFQAHDFYHLHSRFGCAMQLGGSDQWGNICSGIDLIRRRGGAEAFGLALPLLTTAAGEKFGKSEGNAVWLDPARTSPFEFYQVSPHHLFRLTVLLQFFRGTTDEDVADYLNYFTFIPSENIEEIVRRNETDLGSAQAALAKSVTAIVHGGKYPHLPSPLTLGS